MNGQGPSERAAIEFLRAEGCEVYNGGWPDLLVKNRIGRVFALELKARKDKLRWSQMEMHLALDRWTSLRAITRRYDEIDDLPSDAEIGFPTNSGLWEAESRIKAHDEGYNDGYQKGYAQGFSDAVDRLLKSRRDAA